MKKVMSFYGAIIYIALILNGCNDSIAKKEILISETQNINSTIFYEGKKYTGYAYELGENNLKKASIKVIDGILFSREEFKDNGDLKSLKFFDSKGVITYHEYQIKNEFGEFLVEKIYFIDGKPYSSLEDRNNNNSNKVKSLDKDNVNSNINEANENFSIDDESFIRRKMSQMNRDIIGIQVVGDRQYWVTYIDGNTGEPNDIVLNYKNR